MSQAKDTPPRPLWVFGYGSLIWNPGFPVEEQQLATLHGFARSFCMLSIHHRGTVDDPGLVLALDAAEGHHCRGVAFRVPDAAAAETVDYLRERELVSSAYLERTVRIDLGSGDTVDALAYVIDTAHVQYVSGMSLEKQAKIIAHAVGGRGPNTEYLWNTVSHLTKLGIEDADLDWLAVRVREIVAET